MKKATRNRRGDGSVFRRKDGRWVARVSQTLLSGKRRTTERYAATRELAMLELESLRAIIRQRGQATGQMTLAQFCTQWMQILPHAPSTMQSYTLSLDNHILPYLGHVPMCRLSAFDIGTWLRTLEAEKVGARTRQIAFSVLRSVARHSIETGVISFDFTSGIKRPAAPREDISPFTADEVRKILDAVSGDRLEALFVMSFFCGLRQGELFALKWEDIDWTAKTIRISRQRSEVAGIIHEREPKTRAGKRTVGLSDECLVALEDRRKLALVEGQAANPWVFIGTRGLPLRRSNFGNRAWKPLLDRLGIPHRGLHHARHTTATLALKAGHPVHMVSGMLGHTLASTTSNLYAHTQEGDHKATADAVSKAIGWR